MRIAIQIGMTFAVSYRQRPKPKRIAEGVVW
jgi:hypothetical protein